MHMLQPAEGGFAEKLKAATAGKQFPAAFPEATAAASELDLSRGGKSGREKGRAKHEKRGERSQRAEAGVSGHSVHTRGRSADFYLLPPEALKSPEQEEAERLFEEICVRSEILGRLSAFMDANGYKDTEGSLMETAAVRLERANRIMLPLAEGSSITSAEVSNLLELSDQSNQDIADLKEALQGLESAGELALPPEIKSLFEAKPDLPAAEEANQAGSVDSGQSLADADVPAVQTDGREQPVAEKRPYTSYSEEELRANWNRSSDAEMIGTVEGQLGAWREFDEKIKTFNSQNRVVDDMRAIVPKEKFEGVYSLTGRNEQVAATLGDIRRRFEENGRLEKKDAGILTALFFDYHRLLAVAEGVVQERERETPIVAKEKAAVADRAVRKQTSGREETDKAAAEKQVAFEAKLVLLGDLLERWNAIGTESSGSEFEAALLRSRKGKPVPPIKELEAWLGKKAALQAWNAKDRGYIEEEVLPEMERLLRQAEKTVDRLKEKKAAAETTSTDSKAPVAKVIGLDGRMIERDKSGALVQTDWERMNPVEQNRLRRALFDRRNEYLTRANGLLKKNGVEKSVDRRRLVLERFPSFMLQVIKKEVVQVSLTDKDTESLMNDLHRETEAFFAQ